MTYIHLRRVGEEVSRIGLRQKLTVLGSGRKDDDGKGQDKYDQAEDRGFELDSHNATPVW
jgi:hypothetical protein